MIDGNLAVKADEPAACAWATCQWGGCTRGRFRLVAIPGVGKLWLCRLHVDERRRLGRPAVKVRAPDDPRACQWPGGCNGRSFARFTMPNPPGGKLRLCPRHARAVELEHSDEARAGRFKQTATTQAAPSPTAVRPAVKPEPSPSRAPTKEDVDEEARRRAVRPGLSSRMASALWTLVRGVAEGVVVASAVAVVLFGMAVLAELVWRRLFVAVVEWVL